MGSFPEFVDISSQTHQAADTKHPKGGTKSIYREREDVNTLAVRQKRRAGSAARVRAQVSKGEVSTETVLRR
jgi:hypothetical protein